MNPEQIAKLVESKKLRPCTVDIPLIRSLIQSAIDGIAGTKNVKLNDSTSTMVFKEVYDSIRQIGDAQWRLLGYEPWNHEVSIDGLIKRNRIEFSQLDRFRRLRNDAQYRGYKINVEQTKELITFWEHFGTALVQDIKTKLLPDSA